MKLAVSNTNYVQSVDDLCNIPSSELVTGDIKFCGTQHYTYFEKARSGVKPSNLSLESLGRWVITRPSPNDILVVDDTYDFIGNNKSDITNQIYIDLLDINGIPTTLLKVKIQKIFEINKRSSELIEIGGHTYQGKIFSLRETAQLNLLGAERKKDVLGMLPLKWNTIDDLDEIVLTTTTEIDEFFMSALIAKKLY